MFLELSITLKNTFNQTLNSFPKLVSFSHRSDQGKVGKTPIETRNGPKKNVSNQIMAAEITVGLGFVNNYYRIIEPLRALSFKQ